MKGIFFKAVGRASLGLAALLLLSNCGGNNNNNNNPYGYGGYGVAPISCPGGQTLAQNTQSTLQSQWGTNGLTVNIFDQSNGLTYLNQSKSITMQGTLTWNDLSYIFGQSVNPNVGVCSPTGGNYTNGQIQITLQGYAQIPQYVYPQQQYPYGSPYGYGPQMPQQTTVQKLVTMQFYGGMQQNVNRMGGQAWLSINGQSYQQQAY